MKAVARLRYFFTVAEMRLFVNVRSHSDSEMQHNCSCPQSPFLGSVLQEQSN